MYFAASTLVFMACIQSSFAAAGNTGQIAKDPVVKKKAIRYTITTAIRKPPAKEKINSRSTRPANGNAAFDAGEPNRGLLEVLDDLAAGKTWISAKKDALCDRCLAKLMDKYILNANSHPEEQRWHAYFIEHFKMLNDNYQIYAQTMGADFDKYRDILFQRPVQETTHSMIYNVPFETEDEMARFQYHLREYTFLVNLHCKDVLANLKDTYTTILTAWGLINQINANETPQNKKVKHANYFDQYRSFLRQLGSNSFNLKGELALAQGILKNRGTKSLRFEVQKFYNTVALRMLWTQKMSADVLNDLVFPYAEFNFTVGSFQILPFLLTSNLMANQQPMETDTGIAGCNEEYKACLQKAIDNIILNREFISAENIYNIFRLYRVCHNLRHSTFARFIQLVSDKINEADDSSRHFLAKLHENLILHVLSTHHGLYCEHVSSFAAVSLVCPHLKQSIDAIVDQYIGKPIYYTPHERCIPRFVYDLCKDENFGMLKRFFIGLSPRISCLQAFSLLEMVASEDSWEMNIRIGVLFELVNCGILNQLNHPYIMQNIREAIRDIRSRRNILNAYALAMSIYQYATGNQNEMHKTHTRFFQMHFPAHPNGSDHNYPHGSDANSHRRDVFLTRFYDIFLKSSFDTLQQDSRGASSQLPVHGVIALQKLWEHLGPKDKISPKHPCYCELSKAKVFLFQKLRDHYKGMSRSSLLSNEIFDLLEARESLPDVYSYYVNFEPNFKQILRLEQFFYFTERRGKWKMLKQRQIRGSIDYASQLETELAKRKEFIEQNRDSITEKKFRETVKEICTLAYTKGVTCRTNITNLNSILDETIMVIAETWETRFFTTNEWIINRDLRSMTAFYSLFNPNNSDNF